MTTHCILASCKIELDHFLSHLNNQHPQIKFTIELEKENQLLFLDVLDVIKKKSKGKIEYTVYRRETYTQRYLNAESHHHPTKTLIWRSERSRDTEHKNKEQKKINDVL